MKSKFLVIFICIIFLLNSILLINSQETDDNLIQLSILLDTSNSMDGLINQAKSQIWSIVNELATAKKNDKSPILQVALYEYGNDTLEISDGYIRQVSGFTTDLDMISEDLFSLTTNGGEEFCGEVILKSIKNLKWSKKNNILKVIVIAGNEPFNQGSVDYNKSCQAAINKGIIVNTIFCGDKKEGIKTFWKNGAEIADGKYMNINQNFVMEDIDAPQDDEIIKLNNELNNTYIAYGNKGNEKKVLQEKQDKNARGMNKTTLINRTITKSNDQYKNTEWDMVDAFEEGEMDVNDIKESELPEEMKGMNEKEKEEYIQKKLEKRKEIQKKINKLNEERKKYIEVEIKKRSIEDTLDKLLIEAIQEQGRSKNYKF